MKICGKSSRGEEEQVQTLLRPPRDTVSEEQKKAVWTEVSVGGWQRVR